MSGIYAFDENLGQSFEDTAAATGIEDGQQPPSDSWTDADSYKGTGSSIAQGIMREGVEKTAQKGALVMSVAPILGDKIYSAITGEEETRGQDWYFKNVVDPTTAAIDHFVPDPETTGHSAQVLGSLAGGFSQLAAGGAVNMVSNAFSGTTLDLTEQGVDLDTAMKVGGVQSGATALAFTLLPGYGATLAKQIATGAGINLGTSMVAAEASNRVLDGNGYEQPAEQFNPWDVEARVIDTVMGAAFGGQNHFGMKFSRQHTDALATAANFKSFAMDSAPGRPLSDADFNAHQTNMDMGLKHLLQDKPFDDSMVRDAGFEQKPVRLDADEIRGEFPSYKDAKPEAAPIHPDEYAAQKYMEMAKADGLTPEATAELQAFKAADKNAVSGLHSDRELQASLERAANSDTPMRYVEADTHNLGGINNAMGANSKADAVIADIGKAYAEAFDGHPVYHRGAGRFAAIVPDGFDVAGAQAKADAAVAEILAKPEYKLTDVADKKSGQNGSKLFHGDSAIIKGSDVDSIIQPAQDIINTARPKGEVNVKRSEAFKAWSESLGGAAREIAGRAKQAFSDWGTTRQDRESAARREAEALRRDVSGRPEAAQRSDLGENAGHINPDNAAAAKFKAVADKHNLSPELRQKYAPKIYKDDLTGWYTNNDRAATIQRAQTWAEANNKPSAYVVADISNLGGLNEALGQHAADQVYREFSEILHDHAKTLDAEIVPFRHGGDEVSFVIAGADAEQARAVMAKAAADVQRYVNRIGVNDLPHGKYIGQPDKYGSGVYVGVKEIESTSRINDIMDEGDMQVEVNKGLGKVDVAGETMPLKSDTAKDPMSGYAARPEVQQALTADESITVLDDNGNPVSGREAILQAAAEADNAVSLKEGFKAAALCAMRFTT